MREAVSEHGFRLGRGAFSCLALTVSLIVVLAFTHQAAATVLPASISSNMTLTSAGSPYTASSVTVATGATLTIEAGSVIKVTGRFIVKGVLKVNGTGESPVTFTSKKDDSVGGDTNGDGTATVPKPGDWPGILISPGESAASTLTHARILYGGASSNPQIEITCPCGSSPELTNSYIARGSNHAILISKGAPTIVSSTIENNSGNGITSSSASPEIRGNTILGNKVGISFSVASNLHGSVDIEDNLIKENKTTGISVNAGTGYTHIDAASIGGNVIEGNEGKAISYLAFPNSGEGEFTGNPVPPNITTNILKGNKENGIWISGRVAESTTWEDSGYPLVVFNSGLNIGKGSTLTLAAGSIVKNEGPRIAVNGALESEGTAEAPVTFTSIKDDSVGGDTNGDGEATVPAPGDWQAIEYPEAGGDPESAEPIFPELEYIDFRYAETAIGIKFLKDMRIAHSDFVFNEKAIDVAETGEGSPELGALSCLPPYLSFVISDDNWYGKYGLPAPDMNISGAVGATLPPEYESLFGAASSLAELNFSLYGTDNTIPFAIYSCPDLGIPPTPVTPVIIVSTPLAPHFPDPEVE